MLHVCILFINALQLCRHSVKHCLIRRILYEFPGGSCRCYLLDRPEIGIYRPYKIILGEFCLLLIDAFRIVKSGLSGTDIADRD